MKPKSCIVNEGALFIHWRTAVCHDYYLAKPFFLPYAKALERLLGWIYRIRALKSRSVFKAAPID